MMTRSSRRLARLAIASVLLAAPAVAQPTPSPAESARTLYVEGKDLRRTGDLERSLEKLEAAHALYPTPVTGLEAARGNALLSHYKKAVALLESLSSLPVKPGEKQKTADARAEAATLLAQYRDRLGKLRVQVEPASARVTVDGDEVSGDARLAWPVDPGMHHVVAEAGELRANEDVRVVEGEERSLSLSLVAPTAAAPGGVIVTGGDAPVATMSTIGPREAPPPASSVSPLAYAGFGVAAVGLVTGSITGIMTIARASDLKDECRQGACLPDSHLQTTQMLGTVSTVAFIVGGAGLLFGLGALVLGEPPRKVARAVPWVSVTGGGLGGTFR
jgi:hypothetical protein